MKFASTLETLSAGNGDYVLPLVRSHNIDVCCDSWRLPVGDYLHMGSLNDSNVLEP